MNQRAAAIRRTRPVTRQSGFTLIELMIAMILGLVVIAGITSVFLAGQQSFRTNHALSDVQDSSRIAFELMARDLRQAGFTGCGSDRVGNVLNNSPSGGGTDWWANWNNAVRGYGNSSDADPAVTSGSAVANRVATTDSIEVISATTLPASVSTATQPPDTFLLAATPTGLSAGDVIVVCDPDHATTLQANTVSGKSVTYAASGTPGNCTTNLSFPVACGASGTSNYQYTASATVATLNAVDWYVGHNDEGGTSLYRISLQNSGGTPTSSSQEMVRDVTDMAITYLQGGTSFVVPASVTDWTKVTAVHVELTVESSFKRAGTDTKPISRTFAFTTTLRNRVE